MALVIREEQKAALEEAQRRLYEEKLAAHLRRFFPAECARLGDAGLREAIRRGVRRASRHGIVSERDVCKFVSLTLFFGRDFDADPRLPWAAAILGAGIGPTLRVNRLYLEALERLAEARGYDG